MRKYKSQGSLIEVIRMFKIGDKVKTVNEIPNYTDDSKPLPIGSIGFVTHIDEELEPDPFFSDVHICIIGFHGQSVMVNHEDIELIETKNFVYIVERLPKQQNSNNIIKVYDVNMNREFNYPRLIGKDKLNFRSVHQAATEIIQLAGIVVDENTIIAELV